MMEPTSRDNTAQRASIRKTLYGALEPLVGPWRRHRLDLQSANTGWLHHHDVDEPPKVSRSVNDKLSQLDKRPRKEIEETLAEVMASSSSERGV